MSEYFVKTFYEAIVCNFSRSREKLFHFMLFTPLCQLSIELFNFHLAMRGDSLKYLSFFSLDILNSNPPLYPIF